MNRTDTNSEILIQFTSCKDVIIEMESLRSQVDFLKDENELLFETNNMLIKELRDSKDKYIEVKKYEAYLIDSCKSLNDKLDEAKQEIRRLKNPKSCGMCITCIECSQSVGGEF